MKKLLIFHPYLSPYRLDFYNKISELYMVKALLSGSLKEKQSLGFNLELVNNAAKFSFEYINKGMYLGRHLISYLYLKTIKSFKPDLILAHELGINTILAILLKPYFGYKVFVTIDDSPSMIKRPNKVRSFLRSLIVHNTECILVVHPEVKSYLESYYPSTVECKFLYFPIIQDENILQKKLDQAENTAKEFYHYYNLAGKKVILFVGRLEPQKCPDLLIDAYKQIADTSSVLIFVGNGNLYNHLKAKVNELNLNYNVLFMGRLSGDALYAWYRLANTFVLPSQFEPFGAVINEALVAGCKVITSEQVGANCLIEENVNGVIFKSNDVNDLAAKLKLVLFEIDASKVAIHRVSLMKLSFNSIVAKFCNLV